MPATVRLFTQSDQVQVLPLVLSIQREEFGIPVSAEEQTDLRDVQTYYVAAGAQFWVAVDDGAIMGTIGLLNIGHGDVALRKMFVAPSYRGKPHGIAAALLAASLAWAATAGFRRVLLGTTEKFLAAHRFYEKNGFEVTPVDQLPEYFPRMRLDTRFYNRTRTPGRAQ